MPKLRYLGAVDRDNTEIKKHATNLSLYMYQWYQDIERAHGSMVLIIA